MTILEQIVFSTYEGMVRIMYQEGESEDLAELLRALPGVTTVTNAGSAAEMSSMTFKVKLISQKGGEEAAVAVGPDSFPNALRSTPQGFVHIRLPLNYPGRKQRACGCVL